MICLQDQDQQEYGGSQEILVNHCTQVFKTYTCLSKSKLLPFTTVCLWSTRPTYGISRNCCQSVLWATFGSRGCS